jgi:hypothetical protein
MDANLVRANLRSVSFENADMARANLAGADLTGANLCAANLAYANLARTHLEGASFRDAWFDRTLLVDVEMSWMTEAHADRTRHQGPSSVGTNTLLLSKGRIPASFLRGCGLSEWEIETAKLYEPNLSSEEITNIQYKVFSLRAKRPFQISPVFISYSWAVESPWVEYEVEKAVEISRNTNRDVLCPIALDEAWTSSRMAGQLRTQIKKYRVLSFKDWQDAATFKHSVHMLFEGLELFYRHAPA